MPIETTLPSAMSEFDAGLVRDFVTITGEKFGQRFEQMTESMIVAMSGEGEVGSQIVAGLEGGELLETPEMFAASFAAENGMPDACREWLGYWVSATQGRGQQEAKFAVAGRVHTQAVKKARENRRTYTGAVGRVPYVTELSSEIENRLRHGDQHGVVDALHKEIFRPLAVIKGEEHRLADFSAKNDGLLENYARTKPAVVFKAL